MDHDALLAKLNTPGKESPTFLSLEFVRLFVTTNTWYEFGGNTKSYKTKGSCRFNGSKSYM